jgi:hypothetical protein
MKFLSKTTKYTLPTKEMTIFVKIVKYNQFWNKSITVTVNGYNTCIEWRDPYSCRLL